MSERLTKEWTPNAEGAYGENGRKGDHGESLAAKLFESYNIEYIHYPDDREKQEAGKDFEIRHVYKDSFGIEVGEWVGVDIKANIHNDGNDEVCVDAKIMHTGAKYWLHINRKDHLGKYIMYETEKMKQYIIQYKIRQVGKDGVRWINKKIANNLDKWI